MSRPAAVLVSVGLIVGLIGTPAGAVAAPHAQAAAVDADPGMTAPSPDATAQPTPAPSPSPSPSQEPDPAPSSSPQPEPAPSPAPSPSSPEVAVPAPTTPAEKADSPPAAAPEAGSPALDEADVEAGPGIAPRAQIGIMAAGDPEAGVEVWSETFEEGLTTTTPTGISTYASGRYTASAAWANGANCTGVLVNYTAVYPNSGFCPSEPILGGIAGSSTLGARETRRLADVAGQVGAGVTGSSSATSPVAGSTASTRTNHALTSAPYAAIGTGNTLVLRSAAGIGVSAPTSRYYTLRVDVAGDECANNPASLTFTLLSGGTTFSPFTGPVVPCTNAVGTYYTSTPALAATGGGLDGTTTAGAALTASVRAGTYTGSSAVLLSPAQAAAAQVNVTNSVTSSVGNAFAIDNIRILDVTPSLDIAFSPPSVVAGTASTLIYTVTNTSELAAKTDWGFTNTLPSGLAIAPAPAVGGSCVTAGGAAVTATAGSGSVAVTGGDLAAGTASCTITVNVVSPTAGTYTITPGSVSTSLNAPEAAVLTVTPASTITVRKNIASRVSASDQFTLSLRSGTTVLASATTTGTATGLQPAQITRQVVQPNATYTIHEATTTGAGLTYSSSYECVRGTTVIAAGSSPAGTITMPADQGAEIVCTFTNTPQTARLACDTSHMYSVSPTGALVQGDIVAGTTAAVGTWTGATSANALGVGAGGSIAYALERSADGTDVTSVLKWTPAAGFQTIAGSAYTTVAGSTTIDGSIVAGAIDLSGTRYYFGKFVNSQFYLWSFTESNPATSRFAFVGSFATGTAPNGNGDLAFDARGNLYVIGAATVNNVSSAAIYTVSAQTLATAAGGTLAVAASTTKALAGTDASPAFGNVNGIAFSPRGTVYLSSTTSVYEFDASTWTRVAATPRIAVDSTDLAGCTSPATITVLKNTVGRAAAADQFTLTLASGATPVATATTAGSATGRQPQQIGPVPAAVGTTFSVSEAMAAGSASPISVYTTAYECWADGVRLSNGTTTSGTVTIPSRLSVNVVCTFFNSPRPVTTVTVTKQIADPATGALNPAPGWTLGVTATATAGTATVLPSESATQTTDASGTATWTVLFGSVGSRATLVVYEQLQSGFTFARASCTVNGAAVPVTFTTSAGVVRGSITAVQSASAVACTFVNNPVAVLTLAKEVGFGSAMASDWTLSATAPAGALTGPAGRSGTSGVSAVPVTPGVPYRLAETGGTALYVQVGGWRCLTSTGATVPVTAAGDVTLPQGASVTCTVVNSTATITLLKQVQNPQPGFEPDDWTVTATPAALAGASLPTSSRPGAEYVPGGNAASTFEVRPGHGYTLSEEVTAVDSRLAYRTLRLERLDSNGWTPVASRAITAPAPGQNATYRFVNAPLAPTTLPLTGGPSADAFLISGSVVLALALAWALWHRRRVRGRL
ncbi:prealbumin-like fold domain-containing protein [Microbacterium yannicii]|uniref:DUF7933 domain-containing protein n=1 Tax=Microbacterium yannicii TaxID=671622 RepID=UPI0003040BAD|nr:hypothetical protein [Microbacterium yannicii]